MSCRADSRGNCVSVSRVMTYLMERKNRGLSDDLRKTFAAAAAQKGVELHQLSALALVTHPQAFARDSSGAVDGRGRKDRPVQRAYLRFRALIPARARSSSGPSSGKRFCRRVGPIGQQSEMQMRIPICQMMNLQRLEQRIDAFQTVRGSWERPPWCGNPGQCRRNNPGAEEGADVTSSVASQFSNATAS